jgi:hypothetical protein
MSNFTQTPRVLTFDLRAIFIAAFQAQVALLSCQKNRHFSDKRDEDTHCAQHANMQNMLIPIRNRLRKRQHTIAGITGRLQTSLNVSTVDVLLVLCHMEDIIGTIVHSACTPVMSTTVREIA